MVDPIQSEQLRPMNGLAAAIDDVFNGEARPKRWGFCLFVAEFGKIEGGRVNYISNGERGDMIVMVKEWLARAEGRYSEAGGKA